MVSQGGFPFHATEGQSAGTPFERDPAGFTAISVTSSCAEVFESDTAPPLS
jgi:hypothetical protein